MGKDSPGQLKQKDIDRLVQADKDANRVNQVTPTGSLTYSGNTATTSLTPEEQAILEQNQLVRLLGGQSAEGLFSGVADGRAGVEQATYDRAVSLMAPQFARREEQLRQRLANQGLPQESVAFRSELGRFDDTYNRSIEQAALNAVLAGGAEESRIYNQILALSGYGAPAAPSFINIPNIDIPFQQGGGGASRGQSALTGALGGASTGAAFGPWGAAAGGIIGGGLGYAAGG